MAFNQQHILIALACLFCASELNLSLAIAQDLCDRSHQLTYLGQEKIPAFQIDGLRAHVHTQGIFVTSSSLYVTGRLEQTSRRAVFLRFNRSDLSQVEFLDITPLPNDKLSIKAGLDHPGGFDYDGKSFWIPVAISRPHSSTAIVKIPTPLDAPLVHADSELAFVVDDHVGALAVDQMNDCIYGANWDTKTVYRWHTNGTALERVPREKFLRNRPNWALAIQDWKCLPHGVILASGFDKDPYRDKSQSRATLDWLDIRQHRLLDRIRVIGPDRGDDSLTREGMAQFNDELFLLPGDLGDNAILYRYRLEEPTD